MAWGMVGAGEVLCRSDRHCDAGGGGRLQGLLPRGRTEIISQSEWVREKQTVTWLSLSLQMFFCFLSHTQIVQLIKENMAVDFFHEALAGCVIWEQEGEE